MKKGPVADVNAALDLKNAETKRKEVSELSSDRKDWFGTLRPCLCEDKRPDPSRVSK